MKAILKFLAKIIGEKPLISLMKEVITKEKIVKAADDILDFLEDAAETTKTEVDDAAIKIIRDALNIPDNDTPKE